MYKKIQSYEYIDSKGYKRYKSNKKLIHRNVAFKYCEKHPFEKFKNCEVHHIDGNKLNNSSKNLFIVTRDEHTRLHKNNASIDGIKNSRSFRIEAKQNERDNFKLREKELQIKRNKLALIIFIILILIPLILIIISILII
ncbi:MAG: HNH endonuclease [Candidatus Nanoarchaeia archaeon]